MSCPQNHLPMAELIVISAVLLGVVTLALTIIIRLRAASTTWMRVHFKCTADYLMTHFHPSYFHTAKHLHKLHNIPPGSFGLPLLGESLQFISSYRSRACPDTFITERRSQYGRIFTTHLFGKPTVVSLDAEVNRFILNSDGRLFVPDYPTSLKQLWGKWAILMLEGNLHKRMHGLVAALLKSEGLKDHLLYHIEALVQQSMQSWSTHTGPIFVEDETKKISFQVTAKVLLGLEPGETIMALRAEFHKFIAGVVSLPINFPGTSFYYSLQSRARMVQMIKNIVKEREESGTVAKVHEHKDILGVLLEERKLTNLKRSADKQCEQKEETFCTTQAMPLEVITDNILSFFFPAEDSVPMLMTLAVKNVSECPRALLQIREENLDLLQKSKGQQLTSRHYLTQLPFTHCVLNETLRLGNTVKGVIRKALVDVHVKGFVIPKGWAVFPFFRGVHLDEAIYKDAHRFNPWRWQEKVALSHYSPFGGGPRYCPGLDIARLEAVVFLHHLVTKYEWELKEKDTLTHFPFVKLAKRLPINILKKYDMQRQQC